MDFFSVVALLGGLAMFLYGMEVMGDGLKKSSGSALKSVLEKVTTNVLFGVITGTLVTAVIQSSTATIVLSVGLLSAGVMNLRQAASIVIGANIGTTVTAQIIRLMDIDSSGNFVMELFKPSTLAPIALIIGIILVMFIKKKNTKGVGEIFSGFGILFSGLMSMTAAVEPLSQSQAFIDLLERFSEVPILGIVAGLVLTVIVQSSSATVGMLQALSSTGVMTFNLIYPVIMGINLGTCITTALVCSIGSSKDAKRTGMVHILFNSIGTIIFMIVMTILRAAGAFPDMWTSIVDSGDIANFQTLFNLVTAILLVPFTGLLVKGACKIVKDDKKSDVEELYPGLHTLNERLLVAPAMALGEAHKAIGVMGSVALANLNKGLKLLNNYDEKVVAELLSTEDQLDSFADTSDNFLVDLSKHTETEHDGTQINMLMQTTTDFERIGDYATNIQEFAERLKNEKLSFSDTARAELDIMAAAISEITELTVTAFSSNDFALAATVEPFEEVIDDMVALLKDRHIERLKTGKCTISTGLIFVETLTYLERTSDQCSSVALLLLSQENPQIIKNHHDYLRVLHEGKDNSYRNELERRKKQYYDALLAIS